MYDPKTHLKRLVEIHAPSGYEQPVADALREDWANVRTGGTGIRCALMVELSQSRRDEWRPRI